MLSLTYIMINMKTKGNEMMDMRSAGWYMTLLAINCHVCKLHNSPNANTIKALSFITCRGKFKVVITSFNCSLRTFKG